MSAALRKNWAVLRLGALEQLAYGYELFARCFFLLFILFVFRQLYGHALPEGSQLAAFDARTVLWYLVLTESILTASPRLDGVVDLEVKSGAIATYLARPMSYVAYHRGRYLGAAFVSLGANLAFTSAVGLALAGPPPIAGLEVLALVVPVAGAFLLNFQISMTLALTAFWVEEARPFFFVYQKVLFILGGLLIPLDFYPGWVREVADLLPFSLVLYAPGKLALAFSWSLWTSVVLRQLAWALALGLVLRAVLHLGSRKVTISGG